MDEISWAGMLDEKRGGLRPSPEHLLHVNENLAQQMEAKRQMEGNVRTVGPLKPGEGGR